MNLAATGGIPLHLGWSFSTEREAVLQTFAA